MSRAKPSPKAEEKTVRRPRRKAAGVAAIVAILAALFVVFYSHTRAKSAQPDVILVTIDTLRADAVGFGGNHDVKTPFLDRMAHEGIAFTNAHAHNVVTLPSHTNILTGLYPYQHGVRDNAGFVLDPKHETVARRLHDAGYATGAFVAAYPLDGQFGLKPGFDVYDDHYPRGSKPLDFEVPERPASEVLAAAKTWYEQNRDKKKFLWIHLYDPHAPYRPPGRFAEEYRNHPYLGEIAAVDEQLAQFLDPILSNGRDSLLIITGDHGEAMGEHGELTHGLFAYEATLHVPLILHETGVVKPRVENAFVRHIDIVPTILERLGIAKPAELLGESLLKEDAQRDSYFESLSASLNRGWAPLVGMIHDGYKYIDLPLAELYRLATDAKETQNLIDSDRRVAFAIRKELSDASPKQEIQRAAISPEEGAKLLALGYVSGNAAKKSYTVDDDPKRLVHLDSDLQRVVALYSGGDLNGAVAVAQKIVAERPDMAAGQEMLAFLLQESESPAAAVEALKVAMQNGTATEEMKVRLGMILSEEGRAQEAVQVLGQIHDRNNPDVLNAYGIALADTGNFDGAVQQFGDALKIDPVNAPAYQNLGIVALRAGQPERARGYLAKALELNPKLPLALNTLGVVQAQSGDAAGAIDSWSKAVALDSRQYDALFNIGLVAAKSGQRDIARNALLRFVSSAPPQRYAEDIATAKKMLAQMNS